MNLSLRPMASAACAALFAHCLAGQTSAEQGLMPYLPADTLFAFSTPDLQRSVAEFQTTPWAKMWEEKQVQEFFAGMLQQADGMMEMQLGKLREQYQEGMFPLDPDAVLAMRPRSVTLALTRLTMQATEWGGPQPELGMLLHIDAGSSAKVLHDIADTFVPMLAEQSRGGRLVESKVGEIGILSMLPPEDADTVMGLRVAKVPGGLLIGTLESDLLPTLKAYMEGAPRLGKSPAYISSMQPLGMANRTAEMFVQPSRAVDTVMGMVEMAIANQPQGSEPEVDIGALYKALDVLGVTGMKGMGMRSGYEKGQGVSRTFVACPADERTGLMSAMDGTISRDFLRWVPQDAVWVQAGAVNPTKIFDTLLSAMDAYDEDMGKMARGGLQQLTEQMGVDIEQDFFKALGDGYAMWMLPNSQILQPPESIVLVEVKDAERLLKTLRTLDELAEESFDLRTSQRRGVETHSVRLELGPGGLGGGQVPFDPTDFLSPTFAFHDGYLVAGFAAGDVRRAIKTMKRSAEDQRECILDNQEFASFAKRLEGRSISGMSWTDNTNLLKGYYQGLVGMAGFIPMDADSPVNLSLIPDYDTLGQHMTPTQSWQESNDAGFMSSSESPFGPEMLAVVGVAAAAGVLATFWMAPGRSGMGPR